MTALCGVLTVAALAACRADPDRPAEQLRHFRDQACACRDRACFDRVGVAISRWGLRHARELAGQPANDETRALVREFDGCHRRRERLQ